MLLTFAQHAPWRSYHIISLVPSQSFIQSDHMPISCDSHPLCHASTLSSMLSSSCQSQTIQLDDEFTHHLHQLWLEVNNIMRWSPFWIADSGLGSWSSWWTGRAMGMRRTPGWVNTTSMHHDWFHSSIVTTLVHLITFMQFTLPAWTSVLVYQYHDFATARSMHPWRGGDVSGTPKFQYSDSVTLQLMQHCAIPATLCNHPPKKVAPSCNTYWSPSTCRILSTHTMSSPFLFLCLAIAILFHPHLISHIISNTFYISYSPLISFPW